MLISPRLPERRRGTAAARTPTRGRQHKGLGAPTSLLITPRLSLFIFSPLLFPSLTPTRTSRPPAPESLSRKVWGKSSGRRRGRPPAPCTHPHPPASLPTGHQEGRKGGRERGTAPPLTPDSPRRQSPLRQRWGKGAGGGRGGWWWKQRPAPAFL